MARTWGTDAPHAYVFAVREDQVWPSRDGGRAWPEDLKRLESAFAPKELVRAHADYDEPSALA